VLTGNLDRPGGAMFPKGAHGPGNAKGTPGVGKGLRYARRYARVSGRPEVFGEFPVSRLAEEIETPGEGQIKAMFTIAGNPVLSTPNGNRLDKALASLDFMVSVDIYLNETTRHANVILPGGSPLEHCHFDMAFMQLAVRNNARYSPAVFDPPESHLPEWKTMLTLMSIVSGMGPAPDFDVLDDTVIMHMIQREIALETSPIHGQELTAILNPLKPRRGPERVIDFMLRTGPYGDGFGANPDGLNLSIVEEHPHGVDLGPLRPRIPEVLRTPSGKIELAPAPIVTDIVRLEEGLRAPSELVLVGRRHLRTNNSWMHNLPKLVAGNNRCTLQINPKDAERLGVEDNQLTTVASRVGSVTLRAEVTEGIMPGVVSIPHGWGHGTPGVRMGIAHEHAGVNTNILTDENLMDVPSGNAVLNGIPVTVTPAPDAPHPDHGEVAAAQ
jgi:anaerobic selenocysteine-containing dehydrogenase